MWNFAWIQNETLMAALKKTHLNREDAKNAKENKGESFALFAPSR